jgi:hypothetical protein
MRGDRAATAAFATEAGGWKTINAAEKKRFEAGENGFRKPLKRRLEKSQALLGGV